LQKTNKNLLRLNKEGSAREISNLLYTFGTASKNCKAPLTNSKTASNNIFQAVDSNPEKILGSFGNKVTLADLTITAYSFAVANQPASTSFLNQLSKKVLRILKKSTPASKTQFDSYFCRNLSSLLWAFSTLKHSSPSLLKAIGTNDLLVDFLVKNSTAQGLANVAWAYSKQNELVQSQSQDVVEVSLSVFEKIQEQNDFLLKTGNLQNLANITWAFAKLNYSNSSTFVEKMAAKLQPEMAALPPSPQNIHALSTILWALGKLNNRHHPQLLDAIILDQSSNILNFGSSQGERVCGWFEMACFGPSLSKTFAKKGSPGRTTHRVQF